MKEKDFFGVVSAIAQFIEEADSETSTGVLETPIEREEGKKSPPGA